MKLFKKYRSDQNKVLDKPYYKSLASHMIPTVIIVSFAPMILVSFVILNQFESSYDEKVNAHLKVLVLKHKQNIDTFLKDKTSGIKILSKTYGIKQLSNEVFLHKKLSILQEEYKNVFVDLGVVNQQGHQVAYAGPFKLGEANYSDAKWFKKAINKQVFVSDVFLGLRGLPHFIITVRQVHEGQIWILRATIDFVAFNTLVENIRIGETGFAFILNQKSEFQTKPRLDISAEKEFYKVLLKKKTNNHRDVNISRGSVGEVDTISQGDEYIYVSSFLKNGEWLLIYRQNISDAFSIIHKARRLLLLIFIFGGLGIVTMAFILSKKMVSFIARADMEKEMMNQQVIETSKLASVGKLASGVAHEINNPVAIMVEEAGWIQDLLEEEEFAESYNLNEFTRALKQIKTQGNRCKEITHKLLSFARKTKSNNQEIMINDLIKEILELTLQRTKYSNVQIKTQFSNTLPYIQASSTELQQIFLNLINNAIDATEQTKGIVEISTQHLNDHILIKIADTGLGIPGSNLDRIFDPFFTTKPVGKGTGLGLSICYGIIKKMGGQIDVESQVGVGTSFSVRLRMNNKKLQKNKLKL
ncbi:MAG: GHKL domain-containing protein [Desulfobacteraceae bacterium]|nr:GHKL domain-containing protein [Desulfobacteraceae bacterium]